MRKLSSRHRRTVAQVYRDPVPSDFEFRDFEALVRALGGDVEERAGSRVAFIVEGRIAHFHRPYPGPVARPAAVRQMRVFLRAIGVEPEGAARTER